MTTVRRFNRTVTQRVGALNDPLPGPRPTAGRRPPAVGDRSERQGPRPRNRLDLDSGHASRLRSLEQDGLVTVQATAADGRVRTAYLTDAGLADAALLDERSDDGSGALA